MQLRGRVWGLLYKHIFTLTLIHAYVEKKKKKENTRQNLIFGGRELVAHTSDKRITGVSISYRLRIILLSVSRKYPPLIFSTPVLFFSTEQTNLDELIWYRNFRVPIKITNFFHLKI